MKNKSLLTYDKPEKINTIGYESNFINNFIKENIFKLVLKDFQSILSIVVKDGDKNTSSGKQSVPSFYIGGGPKGDSLKKMRTLFSGKKYLELLLDEINTQNFCDYIMSNLNLKRHTLVQPNEKYKLRDFILRKRPCYLNCKLSAYPANSDIGFHTDNPRKLVAMLFYLGFSDNKIRKKAGTQLYSDNTPDKSITKNLCDHITSAKGLTLTHDQHPIPNNFMAFETNPFSWHRVKKVELGNGIYRYSFQLNFQIPTEFSLPLRIVWRLIRLLPISNPERILYT